MAETSKAISHRAHGGTKKIRKADIRHRNIETQRKYKMLVYLIKALGFLVFFVPL
jgi:hypothetical protein